MKLMRFDGTYEIGGLREVRHGSRRQNEIKENMHIRCPCLSGCEIGGIGSRGPIGVAIIALPMGAFNERSRSHRDGEFLEENRR